MSWVDAVVATPGVGIRTKGAFMLFSDIRRVTAPIVEELYNRDGEIGLAKDTSWSFSIKDAHGYSTKIEPKNFVGEFRYEQKETKQAGYLPQIKYGDVQPYSVLLEQVCSRLRDVLDHCFSAGYEVSTDRIGVIFNGVLDIENLPPGVNDLNEKLEGIWGKELVKVEATFLVPLEEGDEYNDRCHHTLKFDRSLPEEGAKLTLDWQRMYSESRTLSSTKDFDSVVGVCVNDAMRYFDQVGEGGYMNG